MSAKKHKRKHAKHNTQAAKHKQRVSILSRYPRVFLAIGALLVLVAVLLITVGYITDARVGLSMLCLFFGVVLILFANSTLPKS